MKSYKQTQILYSKIKIIATQQGNPYLQEKIIPGHMRELYHCIRGKVHQQGEQHTHQKFLRMDILCSQKRNQK